MDSQHGTEPWTGYDTQGEATIAYALREVSPRTARAVIAYERARLDRPAVITAAEQRLS